MRTHQLLTWLFAISLLLPGQPAQAQHPPDEPLVTGATIVVNSAEDARDSDTSDGICDTTGIVNPPTIYSGLCTLRAAIDTAEEDSLLDTITFVNTPLVIKPTSFGFSFNEPININGGGQVTLDGSLLPAGLKSGLALYGGGGSTIQGFTIRKFSGWGVILNDDVGGDSVQDNIIRENGMGISIGGDTPNNTIANNTIILNSGNTGTGIWVSSDGNTIKSNKIGTDGTADLGNGGNGIRVSGANNIIGAAAGIVTGDACSGACNLISGNGGSGIDITQGVTIGGVDNTVRGNFIGTNLAGTAPIANDANGITTNGDRNHILGNLISGNGTAGASSGTHGVYLQAGAIDNQVKGNLIGTAINGKDSLGNYGAGVNAYYANQNTIGANTVALVQERAIPATCQGDCNVILGNSAGISITQAVSGGNNKIIGNFIGVSADGSIASGNTGNGIFMQGLTMTVASNVIGGNLGNGLEILGVSVGGLRPSNYLQIQGNHIGVGPDGSTNMGNRGHGIYINHSADNWIGGTEAGQGNIIAYNGWGGSGDGVVIVDTVLATYALGNQILGNAIFDNKGANGIGIDLRNDGPTANDANDNDAGPNQLQNSPVISRVRGDTVSGTLTSAPNTAYRLEFYGSPECSTTGQGQGKTFLGALDATAAGDGLAAFSGKLDTAPGTQRLTATATDPEGNTSEFSACYNGLVVNSIGDGQDATMDGFCSTGQLNTSGDPECTLRAAIEEANWAADLSTILFDIPFVIVNATISPQTALPTILYPVVIDGSTQPQGQVILRGNDAGENTDGLSFYGGNSTLRGLTVRGFGGFGVALWILGNNVLVGNNIGVDPNGFAAGNGRAGVYVSSNNNRIGGETTAERNIIAANGGRTGSSGILLENPASTNQILGNLIGVLANGTVLGNELAGVYVDGSANNIIGTAISTPVGTCTGGCNVIGGSKYGVMVKAAGATGNEVKGNFVGLNPAGTAAAPNTEWGVIVDNAPGNTIAHNVIAGNGPTGVQAAALTNGDGIILNGSSATGNTVSANTIGLNPAKTAALPNLRHGIWVEQAPNNVIVFNLISGNAGSGVAVHGSAATNNVVYGNRMGVDGAGAAAIPNGGDGVLIDGATNNTIGGALLQNADAADSADIAPPSNLISGNAGHGVQITGDSAQNNRVTGNLIGINGTNSAALPNGGDGVRIGGGASTNTIGGFTAGDSDANIIVGNAGNGVRLDGAGTSSNSVSGNFIGVLADGSTALANSAHGVQIANGATSNTVGGGVSDHGNTIARNGGDGVSVAAGTGNALWQNRIFRNSGLGIDLGADGMTPNDAQDTDSGPNQLQNYPLLASVQIAEGAATLRGTLESMATTTYTLEFSANSQCDPSGLGEGETPLGQITVTTGADGWADFTFTPAMTLTQPVSFTLTATDPNRNTSEFSPCAGVSSEATITPGAGGSVQTGGVTVDVPAGASEGDFTLALLPLAAPVNAASGGMEFGGLAFLLNTFVGGVQQQNFVFTQPVTLTVQYSDDDIAGLDEAALTLQTWDGAAWVDAATTCTPISVYHRLPEQNLISVAVCHLSQYALMGATAGQSIYLPLVTR